MSLADKWRTLRAALRGLARLSGQIEANRAALDNLAGLAGARFWQQLRADLPAEHLARSGYAVYAQNDEDGIIAEILRRIGTTSRSFLEIGVGEGLQCNTTHLLQQGWHGCWIEGDGESNRRIRRTFAEALASSRLQHVAEFVTRENIGRLAPLEELDLASIDIDGNDYWIWEALPSPARVVVIEYNAGMGPELDWVMPYNPTARWDGTRYHGASLRALNRLGVKKGYRLVGCNLTGVNAFFVREDCCGSAFPPAVDPRIHYMPPRYSPDFSAGPGFRGHPPTSREILPPPHEEESRS